MIFQPLNYITLQRIKLMSMIHWLWTRKGRLHHKVWNPSPNSCERLSWYQTASSFFFLDTCMYSFLSLQFKSWIKLLKCLTKNTVHAHPLYGLSLHYKIILVPSWSQKPLPGGHKAILVECFNFRYRCVVVGKKIFESKEALLKQNIFQFNITKCQLTM